MLIHGMNSFSKNILKLPLENMNGKNTWGIEAAEKVLHTIIITRFVFFRHFCCLLNLSLSFTARSPVFSAMFEHEMEESKKVSLFLYFYFNRTFTSISHFVSLYFKSSDATPIRLDHHNHRGPHTYVHAQLDVFHASVFLTSHFCSVYLFLSILAISQQHSNPSYLSVD